MDKKLLILRVGSGVTVRADGEIDFTRISCIVRDVVGLYKEGFEVLLVPSGSVAAGKLLVKALRGVPRNQMRQVYFAMGQTRLFGFYHQIFREHRKLTAELLISRDSFASRNQYFSIRDTIRNLLANDIIPIVGDNYVLNRDGDSFSGNDHLAGYLGGMLTAEKVVFLSSVNGICRNFHQAGLVSGNGKGEPANVERIPRVTGDFEDLKLHVISEERGGGGMENKVNAAKLLFDLGIESWIVDGKQEGVLDGVVEGRDQGTHFVPAERKKLSGVRKWLCTGAIPKGSIRVSRLGAEVMRSGELRGSLLARGIEQVSGEFARADVVTVCDTEGRLLGYGITKYSSEEIPALLHEDGIIVIHADYFYGTDHGYFL